MKECLDVINDIDRSFPLVFRP